jgi:plastocyanin
VRPALRVVRAAAALGAAAWLVAPGTVPPATADDETVNVGTAQANRFDPSTVTIDKGDTVTWQWGGGANHTVTSTSSNWDVNIAIGPPALDLTTTYTFRKAGTYTYVCSTHESSGMKGKVVVRGATSPKPSPTPSRTSSPTASHTSSPSPPPSSAGTFSPPPSASETPASETPSASPPSGSVPPTFPPRTFSPQPTGSRFLGEGGLRPQPPTGRAKGLPVMIALLLIGGVGSAELRAFLANAPA